MLKKTLGERDRRVCIGSMVMLTPRKNRGYSDREEYGGVNCRVEKRPK